jgi:hypothetical protein
MLAKFGPMEGFTLLSSGAAASLCSACQAGPIERPVACVEWVSDTTLAWRHTLRRKAAVVYDAHTKPELVKRWWAPRSRGLGMVQCEADLRPAAASPRTASGGDTWL